MSSVTIFNLTDTPTAALRENRLVGAHLEVCGQLIPPGGSVSLKREEWNVSKKRYQHLVDKGAIAEDKVPDSYKKKQQPQPTAKATPKAPPPPPPVPAKLDQKTEQKPAQQEPKGEQKVEQKTEEKPTEEDKPSPPEKSGT